MQSLRKAHKSIAAFVLLLVFGLQAQATFACEMMDYSDKVENCCCGEISGPQLSADMDIHDSSLCCEYGQDLVLKGSDPEQKHEPLLTAKSVELEHPPVLLALVAIWLDLPVIPAKTLGGDVAALPSSPGTETYLTTQRLRI